MPTDNRQIATDLPSELIDLLADLPVNVGKKTGADLIVRYFFPISHRTLERWPLGWRYVNGQAITSTADLFREAHQRLTAAPKVRGGRSHANGGHAAAIDQHAE